MRVRPIDTRHHVKGSETRIAKFDQFDSDREIRGALD